MNNNPDIAKYLDSIRIISASRQIMCGLQSSVSLCHILTLISQSVIDYVSGNIKIDLPKSIPDNLKLAITYIMRHYTEQITLKDLSDHCYVSKQQMIRYFKKAFNTTPLNYINDYKISKAKELLFNNPDLNIKEISSELGFDNQHYFSRVFIKSTGETPTHYRYRVHNYKEPEDHHIK